MRLPVLIVGGGGHAKVLIEALRLHSREILGILDADPAKTGHRIHGINVIGGDEKISGYSPDSVCLVNALGSVDLPKARKALFERFKQMGFQFASVIHPSSTVASDITMGEGAQIMAGAVIQPGCKIGVNTIVNTNASVDHDCIIGDHVHISPGVTLSGGVRVGDIVHLGTGATVIQGVTIGRNSLVGAGSVVVNNVSNCSSVIGIPAKAVKR